MYSKINYLNSKQWTFFFGTQILLFAQEIFTGAPLFLQIQKKTVHMCIGKKDIIMHNSNE